MPYLLENGLAIIKVKCSKNNLELIRLGALGPASGDQVPFSFEVAAKEAAKARIRGSQNNHSIVISRCRGEVFI
jgi:hypothetical protein